MNLAIKDMLLIEEPTVIILRDELLNASRWFLIPSFAFALVLEFFGELQFTEVIKKLILVMVFMGAFYSIHKTGVDLSFKASEEILKKVSPQNIFLKKWTEVKVKTKEDQSWNLLQKFSIPNVNDLIGTTLFLLSKVFIWILKLIYSTVYHLTYIFAPITAILYFFPITKGSIAGTIQSSLWCMFMPIVLVSIFAIVGNSIQVPAQSGDLAFVSIDHILWIFGVTLLLLMTPVLTLGLLRGGGVALSGSAIGMMMTNSAMKVLRSAPMVASGLKATSKSAGKLGSKAFFEPSVRELLKKDKMNSPDSSKFKQLDKKGGVRNPFKGPKGIDERLANIGMSKNEAMALSKIPASSSVSSKGSSNNIKSPNSTSNKASNSAQSPETFLYDKSFWNNISPEHREGIRVKYGIKSEKPTPNKLYQPLPRSERRSMNSSQKESKVPSSRQVNKSNKSHRPLRKDNNGVRNEI
jgi:hypothetical protein